MRWHVGRSFSGHPLEDECPCKQEACGLVGEPDPACPQHALTAVKTLRQGHPEDRCPGAGE